MSPGVTASLETGNETCTVCDAPASRVTLAKPTSRRGGATTSLTGCCTYTGTTVVPARLPVLATVNATTTVPCRETELVADSPLVWKVVYESPKPNGKRALYPDPWPEFVPGSWSKNFGSSPAVEGPPLSKSPALWSAADGQVTGRCPLGFTEPKITSATAEPPSVPGRYAISSAPA